MPAKVHKITHRHHVEVGLNLYTKRLDKIYAKVGKSALMPKVVKKMRAEYTMNPHDFYKIVCQKYGITPEPKIDTYRLVYGRAEFDKHDYEFDKNKRETEEKESKQVDVKKEQTPTSEEEEEDEEEEEESDEPEPEPEKKDSRYKFDMPERRSSPRYERTSPRADTSSRYRSSSGRNERSSPRIDSSNRYQTSSTQNQRSSPRRTSPRYEQNVPRINVRESPRRRQVLEAPRVGSPRALYNFQKNKPVEQLDYVNVHPGDIVETMVLTGQSTNQETGFWIPAQILSIDEKKEVMDVKVLQPIKYGLAAKAVGVPYRYVRKPANIVFKR